MLSGKPTNNDNKKKKKTNKESKKKKKKQNKKQLAGKPQNEIREWTKKLISEVNNLHVITRCAFVTGIYLKICS